MDQIDFTKITAKIATGPAVIPLLVLSVVGTPQGAMAGWAAAGNDVQSLSEPDRASAQSAPDIRLAQAGSTGGSLGKQGKSASGDTGEPSSSRQAQSRRTERTSSQRRERNQAQSRAMAGLRYDGAWSGASTGSCISQYSWTVQVRNGIMSGNGTDGRVSSGGAANGTMTVLGTTYRFQGRLSSSQATGTWRRPDGCFGNWTASRTGI